ncbi:hypothetical protein AVEN_82949-1 [Araneus ventricosus]|uniref:N-acetyltransferase domain-containing protein n=1 Tax=Araneus ventricosus TaxID=182803 RepID=A0A4Y2CV12_ARAVE|nr:hypothetical protein AVEN_82949-1 [Araneus ventricosus]
MDVTIRTAVIADIQPIMDVSKSLLRKINYDELRTWMGVDPDGFFVAETNESQIVGTCCAIRLSPEEGFGGLFWVDEGFRKKGIGTKLGRTGLQHLGDRNVAIRTAKEMGDVCFAKYGFTYEGDKILFYECLERVPFPERRVEPGIRVVTLVEGQLTKIQSNQDTADEIDADLRAFTTEDIISKVEAYDRSLRHIDLSPVIREMFFWRSCKASIALSSGKVVGFGCLRPVVTGHWVVSPLYSDTESVAEVILTDLLHGFDFSQMSEGIWARFPEKNTACVRLLTKFGFKDTSFNFGTRFNKRLVNQDISKIYSYYSMSFCTE